MRSLTDTGWLQRLRIVVPRLQFRTLSLAPAATARIRIAAAIFFSYFASVPHAAPQDACAESVAIAGLRLRVVAGLKVPSRHRLVFRLKTVL